MPINTNHPPPPPTNASSSAILQYRLDNNSPASFALVNAGGIRATIDQGPVTRGEVLTAFPFGNAVVEVELTGAELLTIFEGIVSGVNQDNGNKVTSFLQVSKGVKVEHNPANEVGKRLVRLSVQGEPVDPQKTYTVVTIDFVAGGGDNFLAPIEGLVILDTLDEVLVQYIQTHSPVQLELDGRIAVVDGSADDSGSGDTDGGTQTDAAPTPSTTPSAASPTSVGVISGLVLLVWTALLAVVVM